MPRCRLFFALTLAALLAALPLLSLPSVAAPPVYGTPASPEPGLVVCYPRGDAKASTDLTNFGAGCGLYLTLAAAGRGEFGQTPMVSSVERIVSELKLPNLRLGPKDAIRLAAISGGTHVAVGEIVDAGGGNVRLTYQLYTIDGVAFGRPVTVSGSRADLLTQLPAMANALAARLGSQSTSVLKMTGTPEEWARLGECTQVRAFNAFTADQMRSLAAMSDRIPAAAFVYLRSSEALSHRRQFDHAASKLVAAMPFNPLIYGQVGYNRTETIEPLREMLEQAAQRFPRSYALAHASAWRWRVEGNTEAEREPATRAVKNAPRNADAYLALGSVLGDMADKKRKGKYYKDMTPDEATYVEKIYPLWYVAVRRAVELDPLYAKAWLRVAKAGTFAGMDKEADAAWDNADRLGADRGDLYYWGLEMYAPKWLDIPAKHRKMAEAVARMKYDTHTGVLVAAHLNKYGFHDLFDSMAAPLLKSCQDAVRKGPKDWHTHYDLAILLAHMGQEDEAHSEAKRAAALGGDALSMKNLYTWFPGKH